MPREVYLVTPQPVTLPTLVEAAAAVDTELAVRTLYAGAVYQLVDEADTAVITIEGSRLFEDLSDLSRLAPGFADTELAAVRAVARDEQTGIWWTELQVPWGRPGDPGAKIAVKIADLLRGCARIEDGT